MLVLLAWNQSLLVCRVLARGRSTTRRSGPLVSLSPASVGGAGNAFRTVMPPFGESSLLPAMIAQGVAVTAEDTTSGAGILPDLLIGVLPLVLLAGFGIWSARQLQRGDSGILGSGGSKARVYAEDRPKVTSAEVAGEDDAKAELGTADARDVLEVAHQQVIALLEAYREALDVRAVAVAVPICSQTGTSAMRTALATVETLSAPVGTIVRPPHSFLVDIHDRQASSARASGSRNHRHSAFASITFGSVVVPIRDVGTARRSLTCDRNRSAPRRERRCPPGSRGSRQHPGAQIPSLAGSHSLSGSGWWHS